jgi:predicted aspartyl protease
LRAAVLSILIIITAASPYHAGFLYAQSQPGLIEVPFSFEHKLVFIQTKINGKGPFNFMLDTGSDISAINLSLARELGLLLGGGQQAQGAGTEQSLFYKTRFAQVELSGVVASDISAGAIDLSKISQALHTTLDGILGYNFLHGRVVQIDFPKRILRFYSKATALAPSQQQDGERRVVLRFKQPEYGPVIDEVYINGRRIRTAIDTGSADVFKITPEAVKNFGLEEEANAGELVQGMGYNGGTQNRRGKVKSLRIGTISLDEPTITFFARGPLPGAIGNGFLQDYVVTFDYRSKMVIFERP